MNQDCSLDEQPRAVAPYPQEALLIDAVVEMSGQRILCTSPGLAQIAGAAAQALPDAAVSCFYLDQYRANLASAAISKPSPLGRGQGEGVLHAAHNLRIECAADLTDEVVDIVAFPFSSGGEAELTRELIQAGHERLRLGGKMFASTDNPNDTWLDEQLRKVFRTLKRLACTNGVLYVGVKSEPLKKLKNFSCEFAFRDRGRLIRAFSRPGVFSHRHIDPGARHLIDEMQINPGDRVLDIGCGAGTVALAAACRADGVQVHAVDSNARAIQCTQRGAELNGLTNLTTELNATGNYTNAGHYDLALANPPYYAGFRIARHFLTAGHDALRPGGTMLLVTKHPAWYEQNILEWLDDVTMTERKGYHLFQGVRSTNS